MVELINDESKRIYSLRLHTLDGTIKNFQRLRPISQNVKKEFYDQLPKMQTILNEEQLLILGDLNTRMGADNDS